MWNLSKTTRAFGALFASERRKGFPMSIAAKLDASALLRAQRGEEAVQVRLGASPAPHPDRSAALKVAHHHPIVVALADGDLVDADGPRGWHPGLGDLLLHVDRVQRLDRTVMQAFQLRDRPVRHLAAERAHVQREPLRVARVLRQPVEPLYVHAVAPRAADSPALELEVDPPPGHREVPGLASALVVTGPTPAAAPRTHGRFFRRRSTTTRAYRSPKTPPSAEAATKPGSENRDRIDLGVLMRPTLLQNRHHFQAAWNSRQAAPDKAFTPARTTEGPT